MRLAELGGWCRFDVCAAKDLAGGGWRVVLTAVLRNDPSEILPRPGGSRSPGSPAALAVEVVGRCPRGVANLRCLKRH